MDKQILRRTKRWAEENLLTEKQGLYMKDISEMMCHLESAE